jgi:hypothetical protein
MSRCACFLVAAFMVLATSQAAPAHGGRQVVTTAAYAYPAYYGPLTFSMSGFYVAPVYLDVPCPVPLVRVVPAYSPYAVPTAAPPSTSPLPQTQEPPVKQDARHAPKVTESHSLSGTAGAASPSGRCRVGFWNVSGRDLTLIIDGRSRRLAQNQNLTLQLGRQFTWQVDQRSPQQADIPAGKRTLEIIIRQ